MSVLISGLDNCGLFVAKLLALGGVRRITLHDTASLPESAADRSGELPNRTDRAAERVLAHQFPATAFDTLQRPLETETLEAYAVVVIVNAPEDQAVVMSSHLRSVGSSLVVVNNRGVLCSAHCDWLRPRDARTPQAMQRGRPGRGRAYHESIVAPTFLPDVNHCAPPRVRKRRMSKAGARAGAAAAAAAEQQHSDVRLSQAQLHVLMQGVLTFQRRYGEMPGPVHGEEMARVIDDFCLMNEAALAAQRHHATAQSQQRDGYMTMSMDRGEAQIGGSRGQLAAAAAEEELPILILGVEERKDLLKKLPQYLPFLATPWLPAVAEIAGYVSAAVLEHIKRVVNDEGNDGAPPEAGNEFESFLEGQLDLDLSPGWMYINHFDRIRPLQSGLGLGLGQPAAAHGGGQYSPKRPGMSKKKKSSRGPSRREASRKSGPGPGAEIPLSRLLGQGGYQRLLAANVLVVGANTLGSFVSTLLCTLGAYETSESAMGTIFVAQATPDHLMESLDQFHPNFGMESAAYKGPPAPHDYHELVLRSYEEDERRRASARACDMACNLRALASSISGQRALRGAKPGSAERYKPRVQAVRLKSLEGRDTREDIFEQVDVVICAGVALALRTHLARVAKEYGVPLILLDATPEPDVRRETVPGPGDTGADLMTPRVDSLALATPPPRTPRIHGEPELEDVTELFETQAAAKVQYVIPQVTSTYDERREAALMARIVATGLPTSTFDRPPENPDAFVDPTFLQPLAGNIGWLAGQALVSLVLVMQGRREPDELLEPALYFPGGRAPRMDGRLAAAALAASNPGTTPRAGAMTPRTPSMTPRTPRWSATPTVGGMTSRMNGSRSQGALSTAMTSALAAEEVFEVERDPNAAHAVYGDFPKPKVTRSSELDPLKGRPFHALPDGFTCWDYLTVQMPSLGAPKNRHEPAPAARADGGRRVSNSISPCSVHSVLEKLYARIGKNARITAIGTMVPPALPGDAPHSEYKQRHVMVWMEAYGRDMDFVGLWERATGSSASFGRSCLLCTLEAQRLGADLKTPTLRVALNWRD